MTEATAPIVYRLSPARGRVAKARQVPDVLIPAEEIERPDEGTNHFLLEAIEHAFFRYAPHGAYAGLIDKIGDTEARTFLYCDRTDQTIAKITITKEYA